MVSNIINNCTKAAQTYGKHKIPRYIYHLTSKANYDSMIKDGIIKMSDDTFIKKCVSMIDLSNFFKRWTENKAWKDFNLQEKLLRRVGHGTGDIVILRIPTSKLDANFLKIRSQNRTLINNFTNEDIIKIKKDGIDVFDRTIKNKEHLLEGAPATQSKLFKQRKEAIEYIYQQDIPIDCAKKIGEVNLMGLTRTLEYDWEHPIRSILVALLKGTPEQKGASFIK